MLSFGEAIVTLFVTTRCHLGILGEMFNVGMKVNGPSSGSNNKVGEATSGKVNQSTRNSLRLLHPYRVGNAEGQFSSPWECGLCKGDLGTNGRRVQPV
jgi:hypothetical protein